MAQTKNTSGVKANKLFKGVYDLNFNFKDKYLFEVKEGEVIYSRGDKSENMFLLVEGRVKFKTYENPRQPKVFLVSKNEFFGEQELIDKTVRNSSAVAEKDSVLFKLSYKDLIKISSSSRKIMDNMKEKRYEEVVAPSRKAEIKDDIFRKIINDDPRKDSFSSDRKKDIELKDNSYENPLLELKARAEITEELKMYEDKDEKEETVSSAEFDDLIIDDLDVKWDFDTFNSDEPEVSEDTEIKTSPEDSEISEPAEDKILPEHFSPEDEDIIKNFREMQDQVNNLSDSLIEDEVPEDTSFKDEAVSDLIKDYSAENEKDIFEIRYSSLPSDAFVEAVTKISAGLRKEETDELIVEAAVGLVNAERGILYYPAEDMLKGRLSEEKTELSALPGTIPWKCFIGSKVINIKDVFNDPDFNPEIDYISYFHIHSVICLPIPEGEEVKVVLQLFNSREGEFSENDEQLLRSLSPVILKSIERSSRYSSNGESEVKKISGDAADKENISGDEPVERKISDIADAPLVPPVESAEKSISLKTLSEFLLQEFQVIIGDIKQFNAYLQRIEIPSETKEISDIVTNQTAKIIDLIDALKAYSESKMPLVPERQSFIRLFDDMVSLLAEYTDSHKVNLYKRFDTDADINADGRFLYLAVFQLVKYQTELMPFGGNIFISSVSHNDSIEIIIRNATKKTDESLVIPVALNFEENTAAGLGLSMAKKIIENHNAVLELRNQSGTGLEIGIRFPVMR